jgi:hypothetical protein
MTALLAGRGWGRAGARAAGVVGIVLLSGCGPSSSSELRADQSLPPVVSAAPTLLPDGSVPWVDEPAGLREFDIAPPPPADRGDAQPCTADELTAALPGWTEQGDGGEEGARRPTPGLYGWVEVRLVGDDPCTLQGAVSTTLRIADQAADVQYNNNVNDEALRRVAVVDATSPAELRVDWSPPYCGPAGPQQLLIELPDDAGTLAAEVHKPATPVCSAPHPEGDRGIRTYLSTGAFDRARTPTQLDSPLRVLQASLEHVPKSVHPGQVVEYVVRLTNPTDEDVPLSPCPGYYTSRFVLGTGDRTGFNIGQVYRLNCRPVTVVPAQGSVGFQMRAEVPGDAPGGPTFSVTWRLVAPTLGSQPDLQVGFDVPLDY